MLRVKWCGRAFGAVLITALMGCDFIQPVEVDPNAVSSAGLGQLLVGVQINGYRLEEGQAARLSSVWMQQMAGTDRQFATFDTYVIVESDVSDQYIDTYGPGGLVDIRNGTAAAEEAGFRLFAGIFKLYEAYFVGLAASTFGDVAYSEAVNPDIAEPSLDPQAQVYAAVQSLLSEAIDDLSSGPGSPPERASLQAADFGFGGDAASWIAVAHTLKARFHMHLAEMDAGRYAQALGEAQQGIASSSGDLLAAHSTTSTENNLWFQFMRDREGYISAGAFGVDLLQNRNDPRLQRYYSTGSGAFAGQYIGSPVGEPAGDPGTNASRLNAVDGAGAPDYKQPLITCAETQFIAAEALYQTGATDAQIRTALDAGIACDAARKGVDLTAIQAANDALTGAALFDEIMTQKYSAVFLNREVWNDYKRTCRPAITTYLGQPIPGRLFYDNEERETNSNIPDATLQPVRNANDPNPC
jgi:hypothetical protein